MTIRRAGFVAAFAALTIVPLGARWDARRDIEGMSEAAAAFLHSLDEDQASAAIFALDGDERTRFHFIPIEMFERGGVMIADMSPVQRELAHRLLEAGLSQRGHMTTMQIMELEDVLLALEGGSRFARDRDEYLFSIFGVPSPDGDWAWRFEGHHVSLHFTIVRGEIAVMTPAFLGANPAEVREGPQSGRRVLGDREDAARALVNALDSRQRAQAILPVEAPRDILSGADVDVERFGEDGVAAADLGLAERRLLFELIDVYLSLMADDMAEHRRGRLLADDPDSIRFAWAGSTEPGKPHYYRVQGPTFLIEYDNTQNGANHIHSVWREFEGDFGRDLLREHRSQIPHE